MADRWVPAQDLFDQWSSEEDELAFARAGGYAYDFVMTPPVRHEDVVADDLLEPDEFALEDALLDNQDTMTLRVASVDTTGIMSAIDDETTGTLAAFG